MSSAVPNLALTSVAPLRHTSEIIACRLARHMPSLTSTFSWLLSSYRLSSIVSHRLRHEIVLEGMRQH